MKFSLLSLLFVLLLPCALSDTVFNPGYSNINFYGHRPRPAFPPENQNWKRQDFVGDESERVDPELPPFSPASKQPKIIVRPAHTLTTPPPPAVKEQHVQNNDGCLCEPINSCAIEHMDFSFGKSCPHGKVRCCRPLVPIVTRPPTPRPTRPPRTTTTTPTTTTTTTTRTTTTTTTTTTPPPPKKFEIPKKTQMCKCLPPKECRNRFQPIEDPIDRKDVSCPANMILCCESGIMGNPKVQQQVIGTNTDNQLLGGDSFVPVSLPFPKVPAQEQQQRQQFTPLKEPTPTPPEKDFRPLEEPQQQNPAPVAQIQTPEPPQQFHPSQQAFTPSQQHFQQPLMNPAFFQPPQHHFAQFAGQPQQHFFVPFSPQHHQQPPQQVPPHLQSQQQQPSLQLVPPPPQQQQQPSPQQIPPHLQPQQQQQPSPQLIPPHLQPPQQPPLHLLPPHLQSQPPHQRQPSLFNSFLSMFNQ